MDDIFNTAEVVTNFDFAVHKPQLTYARVMNMDEQ